MSGTRPDLKAILLMLFLIGTFGLNFPIFISTMSVTVFHGRRGSVRAPDVDHGGRHGRRRAASPPDGRNPGSGCLLVGAAIFGIGFALAAIMPNATGCSASRSSSSACRR